MVCLKKKDTNAFKDVITIVEINDMNTKSNEKNRVTHLLDIVKRLQ